VWDPGKILAIPGAQGVCNLFMKDQHNKHYIIKIKLNCSLLITRAIDFNRRDT
jgi:hypothetical protein